MVKGVVEVEEVEVAVGEVVSDAFNEEISL